jgi:serine-type D-Ala-D-Ala carboxypeptidase/endopeptidase
MMFTRVRAFAWLCVAAGMVLLLVAPPGARAQLDPAVEQYIEAEIGRGNFVGVFVAVVDGERTTMRGFGTASTASDAPPDEHTLFQTGSITKTFTSTLLALLVRDGTLRLEDPAQQFLPDGVNLSQGGDRPIMLADIATHRSGLPPLPPQFEPTDPLDPYADFDHVALWEAVDQVTPAVPPGRRFEYSNFGYGLLGELIARAAGMSYEALLQERLLEPLGMTSSTAVLTDELRARMATGYNAMRTATPAWALDALAGAGAIISTGHDMLQFLRANLGHTGSDELQQAMTTTHEPRQSMDNGNLRIGLGWLTMPAGPGLWHNGGTFGFLSFAGFDRSRDRAVLVWSNSFDVTGTVDAIGMHLLNPEMPLPPPRPERVTRQAIQLPAETLAEYEGDYRLPGDAMLNIRLEDGQLMAQLMSQPAAPIYAEAQDRFFYRLADAQLVFERDADGHVISLTLHQAGQQFQAPRQ